MTGGGEGVGRGLGVVEGPVAGVGGRGSAGLRGVSLVNGEVDLGAPGSVGALGHGQVDHVDHRGQDLAQAGLALDGLGEVLQQAKAVGKSLGRDTELTMAWEI